MSAHTQTAAAAALRPAPAYGRCAELDARTLGVVQDLVRRGERCAYLGWQEYANVGDAALWLAGRRYLRRASARVAYAAGARDFSAEELRRQVGRGPIFLAGGGNLGDVWPAYQEARETVLRTFPANPVVQLPQSVHFSSAHRLEQARRAFAAHRGFTLLVRDNASLERCRRDLGVPAQLCPDLVFGLPRPHRGTAVVDVLWLARRDQEAAHGPPAAAAGIEVADWPAEDPPHALRWKLLRRARSYSKFLPGPPALEGALWIREQDAHAAARVRRGCEVLSRGRVVVTDRLHGHVLCVLLGIPHVILDNTYGKLRAFHETWTSGVPNVHFAGSADEARRRARALIAEVS